MKNRKITVLAADINAGTNKVYNCSMVLTATGRYDVPATPQGIFFTNGSGEAFEFNVLTQAEYVEFQADPTKFVGIRVPNSTSFNHKSNWGIDLLVGVTYFVIKGLGAGAVAAVDIYCLNYV